MTIMSISNDDERPLLLLYREVKSDKELQRDVISESDAAKVNELLNNVRKRVEEQHNIDQLDVDSYFRDWVNEILEKSDIADNGDIYGEIRQEMGYLAENFSGSMRSRARESGKYVVFIISDNSLIVAHSFTGKKAVTTDMTVIEELLSESNIDKFAEFSFNIDREIVVSHFDRNDTISFTDWLGIPEDEIVFNIKGDVRVYTEIDELSVVFEFDNDDITSKLLGSDDYDLRDGLLITPNEPDRRVRRINWGNDQYTSVSVFKQDLFKTTHNLQRAFDLYDTQVSDSLDSFFDVTDNEEKIVKHTNEGNREIDKPNVDFDLVFVNSQVDMDAKWRSKFGQNLFSNHPPMPICHAGSDFSEEAFSMGNYRIYNDIGITSPQEDYLDDLLITAEDLGSSNLRPLFAHISFAILSEIAKKPLRYFFDELSEHFKSEFLNEIRDGSRVVQTEGECVGLEWKSPPWFERKSEPEELARGIVKEFQEARLLVLGINEDAKAVDVIDSGVKSEKLNKVENKLEDDYGFEGAHVWSLKVGDGHIVLATNVTNFGDDFGDSFALLEATN